jgi:RNA polymerase sigma-70 factor (ECF subfamily)
LLCKNKRPPPTGGVRRREIIYNSTMLDNRKVSDEELVVKIRTHDKERYSEIVKRYQDKLMRYAIYLLRDEQKALDVVQDSFIKAYVNLNGFDVKKKFGSWIYRIVHNEAMNSVKKYHKETPLLQDFDIRSDEDVELDFSKKEVVQKAQSCLDQMPVLYSEPLALFYLEDKSYEEISDILRIPMGTVATRINRAKGIMKIICQKNN